MNTEELLKTSDLQKIASLGNDIYTEIKPKYENEENKGKFLAIETESRDFYFAQTSAEAVMLAKTKHVDKVFFVIKIGFDAAETMAHLFPQK